MSRRSSSAAVRRGGPQPRRSATAGCSSSTKGPSIEPIEGVQVLARATALGIYDHGYVLVAERRPGHRTEGRLWHIRADSIVLATGALERPIPFPDNDRPGIMLASAAAAYVERYGVLPGRRFALATTNDSGSNPRRVLQDAGAELVKVVDLRRGERVDGNEADLLLVSGGWNPNLALWIAGAAAASGSTSGSAHTSRTAELRNVEVVGTATGDGLPDSAAPTWDGTRRRGRHVRRPGTGRDRGRHPASAGRRADLDRARQAIHDDRHRQRPGQDRRGAGECASRPRSSARSPARSASRRSARRTCRSRSRSSPGRDRGELHDPVRTTSDPAVARRPRGGVRGRRPVEAAALLPARRRVDGRRRPARGSGGSPFRGGDGRLDPRQDRPPGPGRRRLPRPHLHEPLLEPGRRRVPLRPDVPRRRHGLRRRRHQPPQRRPLAHDHDDRERGAGARVARGVAPDRVAGPAGPRHVGHGAVGDDRRRRAEIARRPAGAGAGPAGRTPRTSRS